VGVGRRDARAQAPLLAEQTGKLSLAFPQVEKIFEALGSEGLRTTAGVRVSAWLCSFLRRPL